MNADLITPTDAMSGIPLPIMHPAEPRDYGRRQNREGKADWHHAFHPERSATLKKTPAGLALRSSRVQLVSYNVHHYDYHYQFYGPDLPETEEDMFRLTVLAAAGYVPDQGLTFDQAGNPKIVDMTAEQRERLWSTKHMKIWNARKVRDFLQDYTLEQDLSSVRQLTVEEFLSTANDQRRWELGCTLLGEASLRATESIKDVYREAHRSAYLPPNRARTAARYVLGALIMRKDRYRLFGRLEDALLLQA